MDELLETQEKCFLYVTNYYNINFQPFSFPILLHQPALSFNEDYQKYIPQYEVKQDHIIMQGISQFYGVHSH